MPLTAPCPRELVHHRRIDSAGYQRADGLWDIEGSLIDTKGFTVNSRWRGPLPPGTPVHHMVMRLLIGEDRVIRSVEVHIDGSPYAMCKAVEPNVQGLVGLTIGPGFTKAVQERIDRLDACTHTMTLLHTLAATAMQTMASRHRGRSDGPDTGVFGPSTPGHHPLIGTCHAYRPDSPIARELLARTAATGGDGA